MFPKLRIWSSLLLVLISGTIHAQLLTGEEDNPDTTLNRVILRNEKMAGGLVHTRGVGVLYRQAINETYFLKNFWEIDFSGMRSDKQVRVNFYGNYYSNANSYVYGKLNKVFILRGGVGRQHLLNDKPYWGGVEVRFTYSGGLSLAMAKPIYLYIIDQTNFNTIESKRYDPEKHFIDNIYGRAPFLDGIGETRFHPGIYAKTGFHFEFGEYNQRIKAIEVGVLADGYPIPVPIMAFNKPHYYFVNLYLQLMLGKRYNKF